MPRVRKSPEIISSSCGRLIETNKMKIFLDQHAFTDASLRPPNAKHSSFQVAPKAPLTKKAVPQQSRRHETSLNAVRSDKQADQADSNTLQLIADITQCAVPELLDSARLHDEI